MLFFSSHQKSDKKIKAVSNNAGRFFLFLITISVLALQASFAAENLIEIARRETSGFVSVVTPDYLSVVYDKDDESGAESEIGFRRGDNPELRNKRRWEDIRVGDSIAVEYEEEFEFVTRVNESGVEEKYTKVISRKAQTFIFDESSNSPLIS